MFVMISVILIVIMLKVPWYPDTNLTVFSYSDPTLLLVYFIFYMVASICFCFMISVLFSKGNLLHIVVCMLWLVYFYQRQNPWGKYLSACYMYIILTFRHYYLHKLALTGRQEPASLRHFDFLPIFLLCI
jgi:hypothetical protein